MFIAILTLLSALSISGVAIFYSVIGLATIFPGAFWPVIIMGSVLEVGKLITASWLYRQWKFTPFLLKTYLTTAVIVLSLITSMGIFGFLAFLSNTFFIDNKNKYKIIEYNHVIRKKLNEGENFIIFPEGTTSDGNGIINFKSSMLECAFDDSKQINIQPISICYSKLNNIPMGIYSRRNIAWVGDTSMVAAMANFLRSGRITVDIVFHELMSIKNFRNRKELANHCEYQILSGINKTLKIN